jgi:hypothetical protein
MDTFKRFIAASGSLAFLIAVITSGYGGGGGNAAPNTLLSDDFSGPLAAKWTIISGAGTSFASSATSGDADTPGSPPHGNPSPSLWMKRASYGASLGGGGGVRSINTYPTNGGLTVSMDARRDSGYEPGAGNGLITSLTDISGGATPGPGQFRFGHVHAHYLRSDLGQSSPADRAFLFPGHELPPLRLLDRR